MVVLFPATAHAAGAVASTYVLAGNITKGQFMVTHPDYLFGTPPDGHKAAIHSGHFTFNRTSLKACSSILAGSHAIDLIFWQAGDLDTISRRAEMLAPAIGVDATRLLDWCTAFAGMAAADLEGTGH